ncbi:MAG: RHS repeat-associated core domain-containing protein [Acidobacteria bacterium]|nr:RHS repeat-associated core domain-containing protein [Acidobacteriota bacterium]
MKKYVPSTGEVTLFLYDAGGKLAAEYSTIVEAAQDAKVTYLTNDHLGSPRINTDASGAVTARHDYHPFGEEVFTAQRTTGLGYASDTIRKQFTGYERDNESGLDFAQARYYGNTHGRFTSPDPYNIIFAAEDAEKDKEGAGKKLFNDYLLQPQNWNRYVYVWNNPLTNIDPDGEKVYVVIYTVGNSEGDDEFRRAAETRAAEIQNDGKFDAKKDKVVLLGVQSKDKVQQVFDIAKKWGEAGFGGVAQVQIFSHSGRVDGPVFHNAQTGEAEQFSPGELRNLRINWESGGEGYFIGCYTANFAQNFANAQNVTTYGYEKYAYFSSDPNKRVGPNATGPLYLFQSDGYANGTYWKYFRGNSERYPMVRKEPNRRR